jgi:hypothetical protein
MAFDLSSPHAMVINVLKYLHKNAWTIVFVIAGCFLLYYQREFFSLLAKPNE